MIGIGDVLVCQIEKGQDDNIELKCTIIKEQYKGMKNYGNFEGIVVDEELAKKSLCYKIDGTDLVFTKGIVGALNDEQKEKYCPVIYTKEPHSDKICVSLEDFDKLVKKVEEKIKEALKNESQNNHS